MATELVTLNQLEAPIVPAGLGKDAKHRLSRFAAWIARGGQDWHKPNLAAYRDHMLAAGLAPSTVSAHLSTIRARYREIMRDRDKFYVIARERTQEPLEQKAAVDEMITRIQNAIDPAAAPVKVLLSQDVADATHLRLTTAQAEALMAAPGVGTLLGLRDTAALALMLCTGIREAELVALDVVDLRQRLGGELALHVREGKGCKERLIPFGGLEWVLAIVDKWLAAAGITSGPVLRGFYKGGRRLRSGRLNVRQVQRLIGQYPVMVDGDLVAVRAHDLRRTYARRLYEAGADLLGIQQNLGHAQQRTTLGYIGTLDAERRKPPAVYTFDLAVLNGVPVKVGLP
jgi:site-specific recombinase XerD